tara:strand:+ start:2418 stop:3209 length:792 start_codon:yes stop_codon:yes gene_type:complete
MITFIKDQLLYPIFTFLSWFRENEFLDLDQSKLTTHQLSIFKKLPFVIRGGARKLPAYSKWTDKYLTNAFGDKLLEVETSYDGRYNPDSPTTKSDLVDMTFKEFIEDYEYNKDGDEQYYLASPEFPASLLKDTKRTDLLTLINSMTSKKRRGTLDVQLFLGNNNNVSPMHTDSYHNFYHMLDGEKEILLIPSMYTKQMKPYIKLNHLKIPDVENIDYKKYPDMSNIPIIKVHLKKGDLLYIPYGCWHQMKGSNTRNLAVALWF